MSQLLRKHEEQLKRGLTSDLWKNFPADEILIYKDANVGQGCMLDPANPPYAPAGAGITSNAGMGVKAFTDATTTVSGLTQAQYSGGSGMRVLVSADNDNGVVQWGGGGEPFVISDTAADAKELVFECAFRINTITANDLAFFIGLAGAGACAADFFADGGADIADLDVVGFAHMHADDTGLDVIYQTTGGAFVVHEADWGPTIAANTWYILGMRYLPSIKKLDLYWGTGDRSTTAFAKDDNPIISSDISDGTFPDGQGLAPVLAVKGGHADDKTIDIRTLACAQVAYPAD